MWLPSFACPSCRGSLAEPEVDVYTCGRCDRRYERRDGIYRFLDRATAESGDRFARQYREVRARDGYRRTTPEYYRMLPVVTRDDPHATEWRVRRESYAHFQQWVLPAVWQGPIRAIDLGAGSGWLSHRLASFGHRMVAVDRLDDAADGLGVWRHYPVWFAVVQADVDALPFSGGQFDAVILNGSLHYSPDPDATLREARRMLAPGGALAVMDSPMFHRDRDGRSMIDGQACSFASDYGVRDVVCPGVGFLTFEGLERATNAIGLRGRFVPSRGPLAWRVRRHLARYRLGRAPAAFGVWVAQ